MTVPGLTRPPRLTLRKPTRPANGATMTRSLTSRLRGCDARFIRQHRRLQLLELRFGQRSGLIQLLAAFVLTAAVVLLRLRSGEIRTRFIAVEFDQHVALAHLLTFAEANRRNPVSDLRRNVHRLVCAHRAQRFDFVRERLLHGRVQPRPRLLADLQSPAPPAGAVGDCEPR